MTKLRGGAHRGISAPVALAFLACKRYAVEAQSVPVSQKWQPCQSGMADRAYGPDKPALAAKSRPLST
jgi:hypothetical protein